MADNHDEYALLFNGITDAIRALEKTVNRLKALHLDAEELVISREEAAGELQEGCGTVRLEESQFMVIE